MSDVCKSLLTLECRFCGKEFLNRVKRAHCSADCKKAENRQTQRLRRFSPDGLSTASKGVIWELRVAASLIAEGWEVFRNLAPAGKVDLIAKRGAEFKLLDVKAPFLKADGEIHSGGCQWIEGVEYASIDPRTNKIFFIKKS